MDSTPTKISRGVALDLGIEVVKHVTKTEKRKNARIPGGEKGG